MNFKNRVLALAVLLSEMSFVLAEVPSLINYQARLTESNGAPVTGTKTVSLEIYDSAVNGNVLYTELIGPVVIAANGIYNFQFGASGTSNTLITEPLASTDGVAAAFQKILSNGPITANSLTVSDGVYNWSQVDGSSDDTAFGVAYSAGLRRVTVNYYNAPPESGKTLTATYRYQSVGITGALATGAEHWMAMSMDGVPQGVRQRVLTVPFAISANSAAVADRAKQPTENVFLNKSEVWSIFGPPIMNLQNPQTGTSAVKCYIPTDLLNPILRADISLRAYLGGYSSGGFQLIPLSPFNIKFEFMVGNKVFYAEDLNRTFSGDFTHVVETPINPALIGSGFNDISIRITLSGAERFASSFPLGVSLHSSNIILVNKP